MEVAREVSSKYYDSRIWHREKLSNCEVFPMQCSCNVILKCPDIQLQNWLQRERERERAVECSKVIRPWPFDLTHACDSNKSGGWAIWHDIWLSDVQWAR